MTHCVTRIANGRVTKLHPSISPFACTTPHLTDSPTEGIAQPFPLAVRNRRELFETSDTVNNLGESCCSPTFRHRYQHQMDHSKNDRKVLRTPFFPHRIKTHSCSSFPTNKFQVLQSKSINYFSDNDANDLLDDFRSRYCPGEISFLPSTIGVPWTSPHESPVPLPEFPLKKPFSLSHPTYPVFLLSPTQLSVNVK